MSISEKLAGRYAEVFISAFGRIRDGGINVPFVRGNAYPQQYANGSLCKGSNAFVASLVSSMNGYDIPVWMTIGRINNMGCMVKKGELSLPIVNFKVFFTRKDSNKEDPTMTDELYRMLSPEEKKEWVKRCYASTIPEFNIAQTNLAEVYPEELERLHEEFGVPFSNDLRCQVLDEIIESGGEKWDCPVVRSSEVTDCCYSLNKDIITIPEDSAIVDRQRFYSRLLHEMAHSTGAECRLERDLFTESLNSRAFEELITELAGATVATLVGVQGYLQEHNMAFLESWINVIRQEPEFIYKAVNAAAGISDYMLEQMGVDLSKGFNMEAMFEGVEQAVAAREERERRREARKASGESNRVSKNIKVHHRKGRKI